MAQTSAKWQQLLQYDMRVRISFLLLQKK